MKTIIHPVHSYCCPLPGWLPDADTGSTRSNSHTSLTGDSNIVVDGKLVPIEHVELSFNMPGVISEVLVEEGQLVEPGQALARLDQKPRLAAAVPAAELELVNAQQVIKTLNETSSVDTAAAQQKVADARDAVRYAERYLDNLNSGSRGTDITKAEANVVLLKDRLKKAREDYQPYENKPEDNITRASYLSRLADAQRKYDDGLTEEIIRFMTASAFSPIRE